MCVSVYVCAHECSLAKEGRRGFRSPEAGITSRSGELPSRGYWEMNWGTPEEQQGF